MTIQNQEQPGDSAQESPSKLGALAAQNINLLTQQVIMQTQDADNAHENGNDPTDLATETVIQKVRKHTVGKTYLEKSQLDFVELLEQDLAKGTEFLEDFLEDADAVTLRIAYLKELIRATLDNAPMGSVESLDDFVRELWWIATGELAHAVTSGMLGSSDETVRRLALIVSNPEILQKAHLVAMNGESEVLELVNRHQAKTWSWLRDSIVSGSLSNRDGKSLAGQYVAGWQPDDSFKNIEVSDEPNLALDACASRWMIPASLVAVSFVDPS
jgi:hypothetical protein